jgi:hypothetical protein
MLVTLALGRLRQEHLEFEDRLYYIVSSRSATYMVRYSLSLSLSLKKKKV